MNVLNYNSIMAEKEIYCLFETISKNNKFVKIYYNPFRFNDRGELNELCDICLCFNEILYLIEVKHFNNYQQKQWHNFKNRVNKAVLQVNEAEKYVLSDGKIFIHQNSLKFLNENKVDELKNIQGKVRKSNLLKEINFGKIKKIEKIVFLCGSIDKATKILKRYPDEKNKFNFLGSNFGGLLINPKENQRGTFSYKYEKSLHIFTKEQINFLTEYIHNLSEFDCYLNWKNNIMNSTICTREQILIAQYIENKNYLNSLGLIDYSDNRIKLFQENYNKNILTKENFK